MTAAFAAILLSSRLVSSAIWQLYMFYSALGLVAGGSVAVPYGKVVSNWFDKHRGLALGLMSCGLSLGTIVMPPFSQRLIALFGWRGAYQILGASVLLIPVPAVAIFLKDQPEEKGLLPDGAAHAIASSLEVRSDLGVSLSEAARSGTFWLLLGAFFLVGASIHGCFIHLPVMLTDRGATARTAALASSIVGGGILIARLLSGYLIDRFFAPHIAVLFFSALGAGVALLRLTSATETALLAAFLIGLGFGAEGDLLPYLTSRYFGLRAFGEVYGYGFAAFLLAGALGGYLMGAGYDWTRSYDIPLDGFFVATVVAVLMLTRIGLYRFKRKLDKVEPLFSCES